MLTRFELGQGSQRQILSFNNTPAGARLQAHTYYWIWTLWAVDMNLVLSPPGFCRRIYHIAFCAQAAILDTYDHTVCCCPRIGPSDWAVNRKEGFAVLYESRSPNARPWFALCPMQERSPSRKLVRSGHGLRQAQRKSGGDAPGSGATRARVTRVVFTLQR